MSVAPHNLRIAVRALLRTPALTAAAVVTLALGIGATTTMFSAVHTLLLRPLEFPDPDRLVVVDQVWSRENAAGNRTETWADTLPVWSYPRLQALRGATSVFEGLSASALQAMNLSGGAEPVRASVEYVDAEYFALLGREPRVGRAFTRAESQPGAPLTVVISYALWSRAYDGQVEVLGRTLELNGHAATIIGVMPAGFAGLTAETDAWIPLGSAERMAFEGALTDPGSNWFGVIGRLRNGVELEAARDAVAAAAEQISASFSSEAGAVLLPLSDVRVEPRIRQAVIVLFAATFLVMLIAVANIANLQLARGSRRAQELAVRVAVGGNRRHLVMQLMTEGLVLALLGAVGGVVLALWGASLITTLGSVLDVRGRVTHTTLANFAAVQVSEPAMLFALLMALVATVLFALWPALRATRGDPAVLLGSRNITSGRVSRYRAGRMLVAFEVPLAFVLLSAAGLTLRSLAQLRAVDAGVNVEGVLTLRIETTSGPAGNIDRAAFYTELAGAIEALPDVRAVGVSRCLPLSGNCGNVKLSRLGDRHFNLEQAPYVSFHTADAGYFDALDIELLAGRNFQPSDRAGAPKVVMVNRAFAREFLGNESAVGHHITVTSGFLRWRENPETAEIVGVVEDVRYDNPEAYLTRQSELPVVYAPVAQYAQASNYISVAGTPGVTPSITRIRAAIARLAPHLPLYDIQMLDSRVAMATGRARLLASFLLIFATVAAVLAAVGLYGVLSYVVGTRAREIGLRNALGASPRALMHEVIMDGMRPVTLGLFLGLLCFLAVSRMLQSVVLGVSARDPLTLASALMVLLLAALVACVVPARRAAQVDPIVALRSE